MRLPGPASDGPYPTLVEYAGYGYANPAGAESGISQILNLLGYAVVDVNMRGTGCSGGAFDYFEPLQGLDGYDVVETVARQPWVLHDRVGMAGVSYGGISQLFVGATQAAASGRDHAALGDRQHRDHSLSRVGSSTPASRSSGPQDRVDDSKPASPTEGQGWAYKRIQEGDQICKANQTLHTAAADLIAKIHHNRFYRPEGRQPALARDLRQQDPRADLHGLSVRGRADRRPLRQPRRPLHGDEAQVVHLQQRLPHRLARPGDLQPLVRLPGALRGRAKTAVTTRPGRRPHR